MRESGALWGAYGVTFSEFGVEKSPWNQTVARGLF